MPVLTSSIINNAEIKDKIYYIWDDMVKGFALKVIPNGQKKFVIKYRTAMGGRNAVQRWYIFGDIQNFSCKEAREEAAKLFLMIHDGKDPQEEKASVRKADTLAEFWEVFKKDYVELKENKETYLKNNEQLWRLYIKPVLGNRKITDINNLDIEHLHRSLARVKYNANRMLSLLNLLFNLMEKWKLRKPNSNPCTCVQRYKEELRIRYLSFHFEELNNFCVCHPNEYFIADNTPQIDCTTNDNIVIKLQQGLKDAFNLSMAMFVYGNKYETKLVEELRQKTKNMMLSKPCYFFHINGNNKTAGDYIHLQYNIEKLFSIFLFKKIYSLYCFLKAENKEYQLINAFSLKERGDEEKVSLMPHLPVCLRNIKDKFSEILKNWEEVLQFDLVNAFIMDKLYHNSGAGLQQYSILVALIGAWQSKKDGNYNNRYKNFLAENLLPEDDVFNKEIMIKLRRILGDSKTLDEIAEDIGEIRNTILHIDQLSPTCQKIKKYGHIVKNEIHIANLCEILFIIVIKAIYRKLGIEQSEDQKRGLLRQCLNWSSVPL